MDFLDPKNRKAHRRRLFIGYGLMAIALAMATLLIALLTSGYDLDRSTGQVIQNGLVIIDSHPVSANITVDNEPKGRTDQRLVFPEGIHTVSLKQDGYRSWQHKITLEGSSIEQLVYPFLFPEKLQTKALTTYAAQPHLLSQSPDRRWLVVQDASKFGQFELYDLNDKQNPHTILTLPSDTLTAAAGEHTYKEVEWASDNTNVLIEHTWSGGTEYVLLDRANSLRSINVTKLFPDYTGFHISLRDKKPDQFYLYGPQTHALLSASLSNKVPVPMLAHALQFKGYKDDTVIYINENKEVHLLQRGKDYLIRSLTEAPTYLLDYAEFSSKAYLVCGSPTDGRTYVYVDPLRSLTRVPAKAPQPLRVLIVDHPEFVSFSAIARFVAVQSGSKFAVYDAETGRQFRYDIGVAVPEHQKATWMDGHRLVTVGDSKTVVFDFDGLNQQTLSATSPGTHAYFNRDYDAFFAFTTKSDKVEFQRTELRVK